MTSLTEFEPEGIENQVPQGTVEVLTGRLLDRLTHKEVADVRIAPAMPGFEIEAVGRNAGEHLPHLPRLLARLDSRMIGRKLAIVRNPGTVLQQLT